MSPWRSDSSLFRGRVTVIFACGAEPSCDAFARVDADVETADAAALETAIGRQLDRGGVVVVVPTRYDRDRAIALGADEALLCDELDPARLSKAIARARLRVSERLGATHPRHEAVRAPEAAFDVLSWAIRALVERPIGAPPVARPYGTFETPRNDELRIVVAATRDLRAMAPMMAEPGPCDATWVVGRIATVLDEALGRVASFSFRGATGPRFVPMRASDLAQVTVALLRRAKHAVRGRPGGTIELSVLADDQSVAIEVWDNREELPLENGDRTPWADSPRAFDAELARVEDDVRRAGGELILDVDDVLGHGARIFLPVVASGATVPREAVN